MKLTRRKFVGSTMATAALAAVAIDLDVSYAFDGIAITARPSKKRIYQPDAPPSDLWTYNGNAPGPAIRVRRGERVKVRFKNELEESTSIHWHGIRIENSMDGVSGLTQKAVEPGETFNYNFTAPDAGTYWYHAHNRSWNQVARGLYGALIVLEDEPAFDESHDVTLVVDDWRLSPQGTLDTASIGSLMDWSHGGRLGNWITVNGESQPVFQLNTGEPYRIRLINASNARILEIDPNKLGALVIAYDGQPLPDAVRLDYSPLLIGPAQRVDLLISPADEGLLTLEEVSGDRPFPFAGFNVSGKDDSKSSIPVLKPNMLTEPDLTSARTVQLDMTGGAMGTMGVTTYNGKTLKGSDFSKTGQVWAFNGVANLATEPFFSAKRGETIVVETRNKTAFAHAMHLHGHHFRIIDRSGSSIDEGKPWRDTFLVGPDQIATIAFVADNPGKWLLHCHMLEHAAAGMNTWFEVA